MTSILLFYRTFLIHHSIIFWFLVLTQIFFVLLHTQLNQFSFWWQFVCRFRRPIRHNSSWISLDCNTFLRLVRQPMALLLLGRRRCSSSGTRLFRALCQCSRKTFISTTHLACRLSIEAVAWLVLQSTESNTLSGCTIKPTLRHTFCHCWLELASLFNCY